MCVRVCPTLNFEPADTTQPVPSDVPSKAQVYGCSPAKVVGSNATGGMDVFLLLVLCVVR